MIEYFELKKDYWVARWLKRPNKQVIISSERNIINNNRMITIGLSKSIIDEIVSRYKDEIRKCKIFDSSTIDLRKMCTELEMPKAIVTLVLIRKGFLRIK